MCYVRILLMSTPNVAFFFFNDTATTEIYTLSLHDALPICRRLPGGHQPGRRRGHHLQAELERVRAHLGEPVDRKSTRLNSSHLVISYAVFCLKKKLSVKTQYQRLLCY